MSFTLPKEIKQKWLDALRSGQWLWEGVLTLFVILMLGTTFGMYFR